MKSLGTSRRKFCVKFYHFTGAGVGVRLKWNAVLSETTIKECRSIVRDESSVYFNVTAVNRYDI